MTGLVLRDVRLPDGRAVDLRIEAGSIAELGPGLAERHADAQVLDGRGHLALPGLVDGHIHLDKTLTGLPWMPHPAGPTRQSRIPDGTTEIDRLVVGRELLGVAAFA